MVFKKNLEIKKEILKMNELHQYIDQQLLLGRLGNPTPMFAERPNPVNSGGGGLSRGPGSGLPTDVGGIPTGDFDNKKKFVKEAVEEINPGVEAKQEESTPTVVPQKKDTITLSGTTSSSTKPISVVDSTEHKVDPSSETHLSGFSTLIENFGQEFVSTRSRKSPVFVPDDKSKPIQAWKSLRSARISSKKTGAILKNGMSVSHQIGDQKGTMYFLSDHALKSLKKKKKTLVMN